MDIERILKEERKVLVYFKLDVATCWHELNCFRKSMFELSELCNKNVQKGQEFYHYV